MRRRTDIVIPLGVRREVCARCNGRGFTVDDYELGSHLRRRREEAGITLRRLASLGQTTEQYLSDAERGRRNWTKRLCQIYVTHVYNACGSAEEQ